MLKEQIYPIWENSNKRNNWLDLLHKEQYDDLVILWEQLLKVEKYCNDFVPFPPLEESLRMYESCESVKKYENMKEHLGANFYKGIEKIKRENYEDDPW